MKSMLRTVTTDVKANSSLFGLERAQYTVHSWPEQHLLNIVHHKIPSLPKGQFKCVGKNPNNNCMS